MIPGLFYVIIPHYNHYYYSFQNVIYNCSDNNDLRADRPCPRNNLQKTPDYRQTHLSGNRHPLSIHIQTNRRMDRQMDGQTVPRANFW